MNREEKNTQRKRKGMRILAVLLMVVVTITAVAIADRVGHEPNLPGLRIR